MHNEKNINATANLAIICMILTIFLRLLGDQKLNIAIIFFLKILPMVQFNLIKRIIVIITKTFVTEFYLTN